MLLNYDFLWLQIVPAGRRREWWTYAAWEIFVHLRQYSKLLSSGQFCERSLSNCRVEITYKMKITIFGNSGTLVLMTYENVVTLGVRPFKILKRKTILITRHYDVFIQEPLEKDLQAPIIWLFFVVKWKDMFVKTPEGLGLWVFPT